MATGLTFRRAGPDDAHSLRQITHAAYAKWVPVIGREPLPMTFDFADLVKKHRIELCLTETMITGLIQMIPSQGFMLLENLAVLPEWQAKGLGKALLEHGEAIAQKGGFAEMRLYTNQAFTENIGFYKRRGYQITAHKPFKGGVLVDMAKHLA
ncbi:MAG: GNAT family N-acetyltransferase [Rhizobiaceae bacterium]